MTTLMSNNRTQNMKWVIVLVLALVCFLFPENSVYTHQVKMFVTITIFGLAIAAFELVDDLFISILLPALWIFFGVAPVNVVMTPWVSTTMIMVCGAFFMAASLEDCGLLRRIAFTIMCKVKGSYFKLLVSIMIVGILLNICCVGQGVMILAPLAAGLCISLNAMRTRLGAGVAAAVMLGACTSHAYTYMASAWGVIMNFGADYFGPADINPLSIMLHCWPMFFVSLAILYVISKWYKPEDGLGEVAYFEEELKQMGAITRKEKVNLLMMACVLIYMFTVNLHKLDLNLGFAILPWMVCLPGFNGADKDTFKKVNISVLFFVAACMSIGTIATYLGLGEAIATGCESILAGNNSPFIILGLVFISVFLLNFIMTPLAIYSLLIGPVCALAISAGFSPVPFAYAISACSEAIIFPYEYVSYLILYGFGMITMGDFVKVNIVRSLFFFAGYLVVLVPYWFLIGLL